MQVDPADVYDPDGDHGFSSKPHVTVMYGFHQVPIHKVIEFAAGINPLKASFGEVSLFENEQYDVLKVTVISDALHELNQRVRDTFEVTETFPTYQPHMTICYLNKGAGRKYLGKMSGLPTGEWEMYQIEYEDPIKQKLFINFGGR